MIQPLNIILPCIVHHQQRIANMNVWGLLQLLSTWGQKVLDDLTHQYIERTNRLQLYMGVA